MIEQCFGVFVEKWGYYGVHFDFHPLNALVIKVCIRLHKHINGQRSERGNPGSTAN